MIVACFSLKKNYFFKNRYHCLEQSLTLIYLKKFRQKKEQSCRFLKRVNFIYMMGRYMQLSIQLMRALSTLNWLHNESTQTNANAYTLV